VGGVLARVADEDLGCAVLVLHAAKGITGVHGVAGSESAVD